jgi:spermidine/putrescine-binding protein
MNNLKSKIILKYAACATALVVPLALALGMTSAKSEPLTIASWGGNTSQATRTTLAKPFTEKTGVEVTVVDAGGPYAAKVATQMNAGSLLWDMLDSVGEDDYTNLSKANRLEPIPADLRKEIEPLLIPGAVGEYGVLEADVGVIIVCREGVKCPANPREFWDVKSFPGSRAIVAIAAEVLPIAVQAGGVARDKVYPIDLDLAFKMLDQISPNVAVWTNSGDQMQQLLRNKEVDMEIMWTGRAYDLLKQGVPLQFSWEGGIREISYLTVLKGAKNKDQAFKFIEFYAKNPKQQALRVERLAYASASKDLNSHLSKELIPYLTTSHLDVMVVEDGKWGHKHKDEVQRRWNKFLSK